VEFVQRWPATAATEAITVRSHPAQDTSAAGVWRDPPTALGGKGYLLVRTLGLARIRAALERGDIIRIQLTAGKPSAQKHAGVR